MNSRIGSVVHIDKYTNDKRHPKGGSLFLSLEVSVLARTYAPCHSMLIAQILEVSIRSRNTVLRLERNA